MILALDISNTHIIIGGIEDGEAAFTFRLASDLSHTADEYAALICFSMAQRDFDPKSMEGAIISSVVPQLTGVLFEVVRGLTGKTPLIVGPGVKTGLRIRIDDPGGLGADFVAAAVAALDRYPLPCVTIDMATATAIGVLDPEGNYIGGVIAPGIVVSGNALARRTAQLPNVYLQPPEHVIGRSTVDSMRSGLVYGTAAMLDGLLDRIEEELGAPVCVVATGDQASGIAPFCRRKITLEPDLLMRGLWLIYQKNRRG